MPAIVSIIIVIIVIILEHRGPGTGFSHLRVRVLHLEVGVDDVMPKQGAAEACKRSSKQRARETPKGFPRLPLKLWAIPSETN